MKLNIPQFASKLDNAGMHTVVEHFYEESIRNRLKEIFNTFCEPSFRKAFLSQKKEIKKGVGLSDEEIENVKEYIYISFYHQMEWPVYFIESEALQSVANQFLIEGRHEREWKGAVLKVFDQHGICIIFNKWNKIKGIRPQRKQALSEAITLYKEGYYYGCTAILMCQLYGIISDIFTEWRGEGKEIDRTIACGINEAYQKGYTIKDNAMEKLQSNDPRASEKQKLLCICADIQSGVLRWQVALDYIYKYVLSSSEEVKYSSHPCRNKICHGEQVNYGDKEHAAKAILSTDIVLSLYGLVINSAENA